MCVCVCVHVRGWGDGKGVDSDLSVLWCTVPAKEGDIDYHGYIICVNIR